MSASTGKSSSRPPLIGVGLFSFQIGGSERIGADLAVEYARRGYRVLCFAFYDSEGPVKRRLQERGVPCVDMNFLSGSRLTRRVRYQFRFSRFLREHGVHALHVHHVNSLILCGIPSSLSRVPVVMTEHSIHQFAEEPRYRRMGARYCRFAQQIAVLDTEQARFFEEMMGVPSERIRVIENGVVVPSSAELELYRKNSPIASERFTFVYLGRLHEVKDLPTLMSAVSLWPDDIRQGCRVCVVGDGPERGNLMRLAERYQLGACVIFLGARDDTQAILANADAFVMSSRTEGLPMSLLEAMAVGLPSIATAVGAIPRLLDGSAGVVVPPGDAKALSLAMVSVARDAALRERIGNEAVVRVRSKFDLSTTATSYLSLLGLPPRWPKPQ